MNTRRRPGHVATPGQATTPEPAKPAGEGRRKARHWTRRAPPDELPGEELARFPHGRNGRDVLLVAWCRGERPYLRLRVARPDAGGVLHPDPLRSFGVPPSRLPELAAAVAEAMARDAEGRRKGGR